MLIHERLQVYRVALEYCRLALEIASQLPRRHAILADQLRRSATSVPLNIAEGAAKTTRVDRESSYTIAKKEASEGAATLDVIDLCAVVPSVKTREAKVLATRVVDMVARLH